jgi:hypothetical protein
MRGHRRAKARGPGWWLSQPWFEPWRQEQYRWSEDYARKAAQREERCLAGGVHAVQGRAACGPVQKASHDQLYQALGLSTVELEVPCLDQKHGQCSPPLAPQVRITAGSARAGRLLWPAAQTDSKNQAQALFA